MCGILICMVFLPLFCIYFFSYVYCRPNVFQTFLLFPVSSLFDTFLHIFFMNICECFLFLLSSSINFFFHTFLFLFFPKNILYIILLLSMHFNILCVCSLLYLNVFRYCLVLHFRLCTQKNSRLSVLFYLT